MRVFVTGGTGLVGSHVIERLTRTGHTVQALARSETALHVLRSLGAVALKGVIEDAAAWELAKECDLIVHAAAMVTTADTWQHYQTVNVEATQLAVRTAALTGARLIHLSSVAVYGRHPRPTASSAAVHEETPFGRIPAADFYARSKRDAETVLWREAARLGVSAVALRPCVIYGERERLFMNMLLSTLRFRIAPIVGPGHNTLAMIYVGNVVDAVEQAIAHADVTGAFNITNDGGFTQRELYEIIGTEAGRPIRTVPIPVAMAVATGHAWQVLNRVLRPGRYSGVGSASGRFVARDNPFTSDKARDVLGWKPQTEPRTALRKTVRWFLDQYPALLPWRVESA